MYIEKNGYLVVYPKELSFLTEDRDFSDDLDCAEIFSSNTSALEAINQFINGEEQYIVLRYNSTVWIDKDAKQPEVRKETIHINIRNIPIKGFIFAKPPICFKKNPNA